jgi:hypothetical protein
MRLSFNQRRKLHEAHEARHAFYARETLSCNADSDELLGFTCTDNYEQSHYEKDNTQSGAPDTPVRTQDSEKRVDWAVEHKREQVSPWDETAKRMMAVGWFLMYCALPGPGSHMALLEDLSKGR